MPPPGSSHHDGLLRSAGSDACSRRTREAGSRRIKRAAWRLAMSGPSYGEDGDVVGEGRRREVAGRLQQGLAQRLGRLPVVATQDAGDALFAEQLLAGPGLGQAV